MTIGNEKLREIVEYYLEHGETKTIETFGISSESLNRYKRQYKSDISDVEYTKKKVVNDILARFSDEELQAISKGGRIVPGQTKVPVVNFDGISIKFGFMTDTHIGSIYFNEKYFMQALDEMKSEGCEFICHTGDVTEGMSNRPGHIYELAKIGYDEQKKYAIEVLSRWDGKWFMIDGNHDRWFIKNSGAIIVKDICEALPDAEFLGHDNGILSLNGNITVELWHGEDGSSYAVSYRVQKIIEAMTGGEKPNVLLCGHTHKAVYLPSRFVHAFSGGALSLRSSWMKAKRLGHDTGFWIIELVVNDNGVSECGMKWYPFYA